MLPVVVPDILFPSEVAEVVDMILFEKREDE
jgi:hypothetical protein